VVELITAPMRKQECSLPLTDAREFGGEVREVMGDEVNDLALALNTTADGKHAGGEDHATILFEHLGLDGEIGDAGLVLQGDEHHALGRARLLPDENKAGGLKPASVAGPHRLGDQ
jgi:hypothetical protein